VKSGKTVVCADATLALNAQTTATAEASKVLVIIFFILFLREYLKISTSRASPYLVSPRSDSLLLNSF
jgi:hypothetical protein